LKLSDLLAASMEPLLEQRLHRLAAHVGPPDQPLVSLKTVGMSSGEIVRRSFFDDSASGMLGSLCPASRFMRHP
jgi:hypothetical protein